MHKRISPHGNQDHVGETINLINNFKVENVIFNVGSINKLEKDIIKVLDERKIKYYKELSELSVFNNRIYFLNTTVYNNENDNSNVLYLNYNNYQFLFMGDVGIEKEKDIINEYSIENIDFLKIGHHGSDTSSSKEFIDIMNPKYSIISVGENNRYNHPKKSVLNTLSNSKIYRTDKDGSIEIELSKTDYKISTCAPYRNE
mgnify:FL=1